MFRPSSFKLQTSGSDKFSSTFLFGVIDLVDDMMTCDREVGFWGA
jgi:hypothetical protein